MRTFPTGTCQGVRRAFAMRIQPRLLCSPLVTFFVAGVTIGFLTERAMQPSALDGAVTRALAAVEAAPAASDHVATLPEDGGIAGVGQSSRTLAQSTSAIEVVSRNVVESSTASHATSKGIREVDGMARTAVQGAEESRTGARGLRNQAAGLRELVSTFKV